VAERIPHDDWAQWYDAIYDATYGDAYRWLTEETLQAVIEKARLGDAILDIGAATGRLAVPLAAAGYRVHAVDRSPSMLRQLLVRATESRVGHRLTVQCVNAQMLDGPPTFDLALCVFTVLLYLPDRAALTGTLAAIASRLRVGGRLLLDVPRRELFVGYRADTDQVERLVEISPDPTDLDGRRFSYRDHVFLKSPFLVRVSEHFVATWWPECEVLEAATSAGLELEADVSRRFTRAASAHWWLRRHR
jgi:SAM-dependent methyltransferase